MRVEYTHGFNITEQRDALVGKQESALRKEYFQKIKPRLVELITDQVGPIFNLKLVGSTAHDMSTKRSDIDILVNPKPNLPEYNKNLLVVAALKALEILRIEENGSFQYDLDLWFENDQKNFK